MIFFAVTLNPNVSLPDAEEYFVLLDGSGSAWEPTVLPVLYDNAYEK